MNQESIKYILEHENDDVSKLLFAKAPEGVDVNSAAMIIQCRKKIKEKIPTWYRDVELNYPSSLSVEQCSSEATARYKCKYIDKNDIVVDLTCGLGVDTFFISQKANKVFSFERDSKLFEAVKSNFEHLNLSNIFVSNIDIQNVNDIYQNNALKDENVSLIYVDPARRGNKSQRVYAFEDCSPNITEAINDYFKISKRVLIKGSPMLDISAIIRELPYVKEIAVVALNNECKEILTYLEYGYQGEVIICADNIITKREERVSSFSSTIDKESAAVVKFADKIEGYLHIPNRAILKAGFFKTVSEYFSLLKIAKSSHIYTSDIIPENFPGRTLKVIEVIDFNKKGIKEVSQKYPKANIATYNFPIPAQELSKRLKIEDGGNIFIIASTLNDQSKVLILSQENN